MSEEKIEIPRLPREVKPEQVAQVCQILGLDPEMVIHLVIGLAYVSYQMELPHGIQVNGRMSIKGKARP
jgi:hypothetical protein